MTERNRRWIANAAIGLGISASIVLALWADSRDQNNWDAYRLQHHCKAVGTKQGQLSTGFGLGANGQSVMTTTVTPDQTIYSCDGGELRIR